MANVGCYKCGKRMPQDLLLEHKRIAHKIYKRCKVAITVEPKDLRLGTEVIM